jgi:ankyrin repeat protein
MVKGRINMRNKTIPRCVAAMVAVIAAETLGAASVDDFRLLDAARNEDAQAIQSLVKQGVPVNVKRADGITALHWVAQSNDLASAELLIRARAPVNAANDYGVTPLSLACSVGGSPLAQKLLEAGANPNSTQISGETALMTCSRTNALDAMEALLARGADVNAKEKSLSQTALMWAASEGHADGIQVLLKHGADVHARSTDGYTALLMAARGGDVPTTQALLAAGADVNEKEKDGSTALVISIVRGHTKYGTFLLSKGADPNAGPGFTPLHWAAAKYDHQLSDNSNGILAEDTEWSSFGGLRGPERLEFVKALIAHGANVNARMVRGLSIGFNVKQYMCSADTRCSLAGATPFLLAAWANDLDVMRELVAHGADPFLTTTDGTTPLMVAAGVGHEPGITRSTESSGLAAVKLCLELGANVNAVNKYGDTALHGAAWRERGESIVQLLVDKGANLNAKNNRGWTPLVVAEGIHTGGTYVHSDTTAALLRKLGAEPSPPDISREPNGPFGTAAIQ